MKVFKVVLVVIGLIVVLAVGAFVYLLNNINDIVKDVIESEGTRVTQTAVTVGSVDIQLREGRGELRGLVIANPEEFSADEAFRADQLVLQIKPTSIAGDVIIIEDVVISGVTVTAEQKGLTTNLQTLLKSVQEAAGSSSEETTTEGNDIRLMIEKLRFADSSVNLITENHGTYPIKLPGLEQSNIGNAETGLTPAQLAKAILEPALRQAYKAAEDRLKEEAKDRAEEKLKEKAREELGDDAEEKVRRLKGLLN